MKKLVALMSCIVLAGCASVTPEKFIGPSGSAAYTMKCSGSGLDWDDCYKKAGEICPNGYEIIDKSSDVIGGASGISTRRHMVLECK